MFRVSRAVKVAVRTVVESLEQRRLLASATMETPSLRENGQFIPVTLSGQNPPTLTANNLALQNLKTPNSAELPAVSVTTAGSTATFKLNRPVAGSVNEPLPDGWYDAYVRHPNLNEASATFRFLNADFDNDGGVSINDYNKLAENFGKSQVSDGNGGLRPVTFKDGDADYDGSISIVDYNILSTRFNMTLPDLPTQAGGVAVGNTTAGQLDVVWNADTDSSRLGFKIYRSDDGGLTYTMIHTEADPNARSWTDTGPTTAVGSDPAHPLTLGHKYWYRVRSYTAAGANAAVTKASGIPTRPTAAVSDFYSAGIGPGRIALKWKTPLNDGVKGYRIYRSTTADFQPSEQTLVSFVSGQKTTYVDSGMSRGHTYYYRVVAVGIGDSVAVPSLPVSSRAQNEGPGFSNAGTPFNPATHDSDNDGTVDLNDNDNDNDGTADIDDDDDDNNGVPDISEPDDRDTDGDEIPDNADPDDDGDEENDGEDADDDNDLAEDEEDASTGTFDTVPSGPGSWMVLSTFQPYVEKPVSVDGYVFTPGWAELEYSETEYYDDPQTGDTYVLGPKTSFLGNGSQTFTVSNLPKHAIIGFSATMSGGGFTTPETPDETGNFEVSFGDGTYEPDTSGWGSISGGIARFYDKYAESTDDKVSITISGNGFEATDGWSIATLHMSVRMPKVTITGGGTSSEKNAEEVAFTVSRDGPQESWVKALTVALSPNGTATQDVDFEGLPQTVTIPAFQGSVTFNPKAKNDTIADPTSESGSQEYVDIYVASDGTSFIPDTTPARLTIQDNSKWFYGPWETIETPDGYDDVPIPEQYGSVQGGYTENYTQKHEWQAISLSGVSPHFGEDAVLSGYIENQKSFSWGWDIGGSWDLKPFTKLPVTVQGNYQQSHSISNSLGKNVNRTQDGEFNTKFHIQLYGLYSYIVVEKRVYEEEENPHGPHLPKVYVQVGPTQYDGKYLGFRDTEVSYLVRKQQRYWLDEDSPQAQGKSDLNLPAPAAPTKID